MPVILLRHTRPLAAEGLCYGLSDLDLHDEFDAAATVILRDLPPVSAVATSPLARCRRLAERIATARGLALTEDARLAEMNFGAWEGRRWTDLPRSELQAWAADFHHARPHGGESVAMLEARVRAALAQVAAVRPPVLWVAHSGVARAAAAILGWPNGWNTQLPFGGWLDLSQGPPDKGGTPAG